MPGPLRFLFLEPFYGGSHRDVADGLAAHSRHRVELVTLADRFWKWRMRGAALYIAGKLNEAQVKPYDGLIVSGLMSLADLKALWPGRFPPTMVYFHENQLSYPLAPGERMDYQYGFTNIASALAADQVVFNSRVHLNTFMGALPGFLRMMPDYRPLWVARAIAAKASVLYPGCHFDVDTPLDWRAKDRPPLIVWNHRWEHDKNPESFSRALLTLHQSGRPFQVALLGERYKDGPAVFEHLRKALGGKVVTVGYEPDRDQYERWLSRGGIVVSTALQENFGIAVIEAMRRGCLPLLPRRLSYPEILPEVFHDKCLYTDQKDLELKLADLIDAFDTHRALARRISRAMARHAWPLAVAAFDQALEALAKTGTLFTLTQ